MICTESYIQKGKLSFADQIAFHKKKKKKNTHWDSISEWLHLSFPFASHLISCWNEYIHYTCKVERHSFIFLLALLKSFQRMSGICLRTPKWLSAWPIWAWQYREREKEVVLSHLLLWPMKNATRNPWASCTQSIHNEVLFAHANTLLKLRLWAANHFLILLTYFPQPYVGVKIPADKIKGCLEPGPT